MRSKWTKERLRDLRVKYGMSQADFADLLRVPVDTLQNWEQGRNTWQPIAEFRFEQLEAELQAQPAAASA